MAMDGFRCRCVVYDAVGYYVAAPGDYGSFWSMVAEAAQKFPLIFQISALVTAIIAGLAYCKEGAEPRSTIGAFAPSLEEQCSRNLENPCWRKSGLGALQDPLKHCPVNVGRSFLVGEQVPATSKRIAPARAALRGAMEGEDIGV
jgi:hypothetical protein